MRTDVTGPEARRALGGVYAALAASVRSDQDDVSLLLDLALAECPAQDVAATAVVACAEQVRTLADGDGLDPSDVLSVLSSALFAEGSSPALHAVVGCVEAYLQERLDLLERAVDGLVLLDPRASVAAAVEVLSVVVGWQASVEGVDPSVLAGRLCLRVASHRCED